MEYEFFDLGEETTVRCSAVSISAILEGIIRCRGKIHASNSIATGSSDTHEDSVLCCFESHCRSVRKNCLSRSQGLI
jgi:hypothetical protein